MHLSRSVSRSVPVALVPALLLFGFVPATSAVETWTSLAPVPSVGGGVEGARGGARPPDPPRPLHARHRHVDGPRAHAHCARGPRGGAGGGCHLCDRRA